MTQRKDFVIDSGVYALMGGRTRRSYKFSRFEKKYGRGQSQMESQCIIRDP